MRDTLARVLAKLTEFGTRPASLHPILEGEVIEADRRRRPEPPHACLYRCSGWLSRLESAASG